MYFLRYDKNMKTFNDLLLEELQDKKFAITYYSDIDIPLYEEVILK